MNRTSVVIEWFDQVGSGEWRFFPYNIIGCRLGEPNGGQSRCSRVVPSLVLCPMLMCGMKVSRYGLRMCLIGLENQCIRIYEARQGESRWAYSACIEIAECIRPHQCIEQNCPGIGMMTLMYSDRYEEPPRAEKGPHPFCDVRVLAGEVSGHFRHSEVFEKNYYVSCWQPPVG